MIIGNKYHFNMTTIKSLKIQMSQFGLHHSERAYEQVKNGEIIIYEDDKITPYKEIDELLVNWQKHIESQRFFNEFLDLK